MPTSQVTAVRALIDATRSNTTLTPGARVRALRSLRADLVDLAGQIDSYLADVDLQESAAGIREVTTIAQARENADLREQALRAGWASEDELDQLGMASHEQLDQMDRDGLLEHALADGTVGRRVEESYLERQHPRGRGGRWIPKVGDKVKIVGTGDVQDLSTGYHGSVGKVVSTEVAYKGAPIEHKVYRVDLGDGRPPQPWTEEELRKLSESDVDVIIWPADEEITEGASELADGELDEADSKWSYPSTEERAELRRSAGAKADGVTLRKDEKGFFVHTHRARSKSYPTVAAIPRKVVEFIESTG